MEQIFYVRQYEGQSDDERVEACLKDASRCGRPTVVFDGRDFEISRAVLLSSGMTVLVDNCTIRQSDCAFDNVFRSANVRLDKENPSFYSGEIEKISHVRLLGRGNAVIEGCRVNRRGFHTVLKEEQEMTGDFWGFLTYQALFVCTDDLEISGLSFVKTRCWAITLDLCTHFHIHDLEINSEVKNGDGVHLLSGCCYGVVERLNGVTSDDMVAIESGFQLKELPCKNYLAPFTPTKDEYAKRTVRELDCHDIIIRNISSGGMMHNVVLLALNDTCIYDIQIEDIADTCRQEPYAATVFAYTGIYGGPGTLRDISIQRVYSLADSAFSSNTTIKNLFLSELATGREGGKLYETYPYR